MRTRACVIVATLAAVAPLAAAAQEQFTLLDATYTHNTETKAFSFFPIPGGVPDNWYLPANYVGGTIYMRLEVFSKPTDRGVNYQICVFQGARVKENHACARYQFFTSPGVYTWQQAVSSLWQFNEIDWTKPLTETMLVVKDKDGNPVDDRFGFAGAWDGSPNFALYYPMQVRFTAIVVAQGSVFLPPPFWTTTGAPPPPPPSEPPPGPAVPEGVLLQDPLWIDQSTGGFSPSGGGGGSGDNPNGCGATGAEALALLLAAALRRRRR